MCWGEAPAPPTQTAAARAATCDHGRFMLPPRAGGGGGGARPAGRQGAPRGRGRLAPLPPTATVTVAPTRSAVRAARGLVRPVTKHRCPPPSARGGSWG